MIFLNKLFSFCGNIFFLHSRVKSNWTYSI